MIRLEMTAHLLLRWAKTFNYIKTYNFKGGPNWVPVWIILLLTFVTFSTDWFESIRIFITIYSILSCRMKKKDWKLWDIYMYILVWFDSVHPSQQFFSYVMMGLPGLKDLYVLLRNTTQWRRWGSNPLPLSLESSTLPLSHCAPTGKILMQTTKVILVYHSWSLLYYGRIMTRLAVR